MTQFQATASSVNAASSYKAFVLQEFMKVYDILRNGLLDDKLIGGQPAFATEHLKKVKKNPV